MICLMLLVSAFVYCAYNINKLESWEDGYDAYCMGALIAGVPAFFIFIAVFTGGISSSVEFEGYKEIRTNLEYQIENPHRRDHNFFEQLSDYNLMIVECQEYNKDWFLNGICVSNKWNDIEPLTFSEAN